MNHERMPLLEALKEYRQKNVIPFDVPGHKHGVGTIELQDFFGKELMEIDVNSMKCLDNLGNPIGVIKEAQELMADAFKADEAFFLVNGTSSGVQAMIMSACGCNDKIIIPRNAHKSAINGLIMAGAKPVYVQPETNEELGIAMGISVEKVKRAIEENPDAKAVFVINPTYYGAVSDLKSIIEIAHQNNMAVLVDEAHGAHFNFNDKLPKSAMSLGADMSAVSLHKTGGSLTQSSALLLKGNKIKKNRVKSVLNMMQTTSASYLLMASLDGARKILATRGEAILDNVLENVAWARDEINKIPGLYSFSKDLIDNIGVIDFDESKLGINVCGIGMTGFQVYDILRDEYNIQMELGDIHNVLGIVSLGDDKHSLASLVDALKDIEKKYRTNKFYCKGVVLENPEVILSPREAFYSEKEVVKLKDSIGRISGEYIMAYPPGIPILSPGEKITREIIAYIEILKEQHSVLTDTEDPYVNEIKVIVKS